MGELKKEKSTLMAFITDNNLSEDRTLVTKTTKELKKIIEDSTL